MPFCSNCGIQLRDQEHESHVEFCGRCAQVKAFSDELAALISKALGAHIESPFGKTLDLVAVNDGLDLPEYPGQDREDCTCCWTIEEFDDRWEATWLLDTDAPCSALACRNNSIRYAPYVQFKKRIAD